MYYIIQKNIFKDGRYSEIFKVMKEMNLEYEIVEFLDSTNKINIKTKRKDVFVYGSVKLAKVLADYDFIPGSYYGNKHKYEDYKKGYGKELINYNSKIYNFNDEIEFNGELKFIKPSEDAKVFTGQIFSETNWKDFVYYSLKDKNRKIAIDTKIQVSKIVKLKREIRFWIINSKIITYSWYKFYEIGSLDISEELIQYVNKLILKYNPLDAYVLDIAETYEGYKIVEINCINSSGFYNADVYKIVEALENLKY